MHTGYVRMYVQGYVCIKSRNPNGYQSLFLIYVPYSSSHLRLLYLGCLSPLGLSILAVYIAIGYRELIDSNMYIYIYIYITLCISYMY